MVTADAERGNVDVQVLLEAIHCELGSRIADVWNLPAPVAEVARHHHDYDTGRPLAPCSDVPPMSLVVAAAERIVHHHGLGPRQVPVCPHDPHTATLFARMGLQPADVEDLIARTEDIRSRVL
jgi:hypothetical protein